MAVRTPFYRVTLEGEDITPWVSAMTVVEDDRQADSATISIPDPRMIYADALFEGSVAEIDLGYAEANQHALMLRAVITKVELSYPQSGVPSLSLKGEDKSILMGLVERRKVWNDQTVTAIVREIGGRYQFSEVHTELNPDPMIRAKPIHQDGKTDLAFLQELAGTYHAKCFVELDEQGREVLYFIPERQIVRLRRPDTLLLRYRMGPRSNLISFSPSFDGSFIDRHRSTEDVDRRGTPIRTREKPPDEVMIWDLDPARMAQASEEDRQKIRALHTAGAGRKRDLQRQLAAPRETVGRAARDQSELESTNDAAESRRQGMSAGGSTFGNIWLRAKSKCIVDGVNQRCNGEWYITNVTHKIDTGGYKTDFRCVR